MHPGPHHACEIVQAQSQPLAADCERLRQDLQRVQEDCGKAASTRAAAERSKDSLMAELLSEQQRVRSVPYLATILNCH